MVFAKGGSGGPISGDMGDALARLMEGMKAGGGGKSSSKYPGKVYMGTDTLYSTDFFRGGQELVSTEFLGGPKAKKGPVGIYRPGQAPRQPKGPRGPKKVDRWVDAEEAILDFHSWDNKKQRDFIAQAKIGGLMNPDGGLLEASKLWRGLVEEASYYGKNRDRKVGPWDILSSYVKASGGKDAVWTKDPQNPDFEVNRLTGERRYVGPQFKTKTEQRIDLTDPATAAAIATRIFQDLMGRDPGAGELTQFAEALNAAEAASPVTATTTTEYDPVTGEPVGTDTITEGGVDAAAKQLLAENRVKKTEEYGVVQAATTYSNALENAVWGAPELGDD